ncbi:hypothetical protein ABPG74_001797 [Tetrahymena malaccensis]
MMPENYFQKRQKLRIGDQPFFVNFNNSIKHPRLESFTDMIIISCCPRLTVKSITFMIFLIDIAIYIGCFYYAGIDTNGELLTPNQKALFDFGQKYPYYIIYQKQFERFIGSMFLFANFKHILVSLVCLLVFGSYVEALIGFKKMFLIYIIGGYSGTLVSCLMSDSPGVDGTNPVASFLGVLFGFLLIKWDKWDYPGSGRTQMLMILMFGLTAIFTLGYIFTLVDTLAMVGSLLIGVLFIFGVFEEADDNRFASNDSYIAKIKQQNENNKCSRYFSLFLIIFYLVCGTLAFFFMRTPKII